MAGAGLGAAFLAACADSPMEPSASSAFVPKTGFVVGAVTATPAPEAVTGKIVVCKTGNAGGSFTFGPSHIHRVTCASPYAVSIHAYSPPLWRLGQYTVAHDGALHRMSVSYADELRPLELDAA